MKTKTSIKLLDIGHIILILTCLFLMISNTIGGWWMIYKLGFTVQQLIINLIITSVTVFMCYIISY